MVRSGRGGALADTFLAQGLVAIGFGGDLDDRCLGLDRAGLVQHLTDLRPAASRSRIGSHAGQIHRFLSVMAEGDQVLTYDPSRRLYLVGRIDSAPRFDPDVVEAHNFLRDVSWVGHLQRDALSVSTRNSLGSIATLFRINDDAAREIRDLVVPLDQTPTDRRPPAARSPDPAAVDEDGTEDDQERLLQDVIERSHGFVEDLVASLEWDQMQDLVAGILRAMGYRTRVSPPGPDRGVDIVASPDGLGLQEPRIFVEVKHRPGTAMGSQQLRSFLGGRQQGDRCLYVSTGGFTREARYEADRSNVPVTLLSLVELRELLVEHYEQLDTATRSLVPLTRLYWPLPAD